MQRSMTTPSRTLRKSELQDATWDEVDFENAVWSIPKERMKRSKAHNVYHRRLGGGTKTSPGSHSAVDADAGS
jgi:hypothetical protein